MGVDNDMALNGTEFMNDPWGTIWSPFTNMFNDIIGNGQVFFLFPLVIITLGVQYKTRKPVMTSMFMISSGAVLSGGSMFANAPGMAGAFIIFTALGIVGLFLSILFQR